MIARVVLLACACSAPPTMRELQTAEAAQDRGDTAAAIAAYRDAQAKCASLTPPRRAQAACQAAWLGEGEVLDRAGRTADAIALYSSIPTKLPRDRTAGATALYRVGRLHFAAGDPDSVSAATSVLWWVVTDYPDEPLAADALQELVARDRSAATAARIATVLPTLARTQVADNLMYALADLDAHELADPKAALALYDRIPREYPASGLRDDARWLGANLARTLGDPRGCADRLRGLLATREVAWFAGSYFSIWLDDAQLLLGVVLRDDLHDLPGAAAAFRKLPKDYPASILRDDALHELAITLAQAGDHAGACRAEAELARQFPDSKFVGKATCDRAR